MSGNSLGSIFVELKANVADFIAGMSKASYASKQTASEIKRGFGEMGDAIQQSLGQFGQFGTTISGLSGGVSSAFDGILGASGGLIAGIAGIGAAGIAAAAGLTAMAIEGAELVENLSNISQKTGISIRDLQVFQAAGATVGVSLDDMVVGLRKFDQGLVGSGKGAGLAALVLHNLGVTSHDSKEALLQTADAFAKMENGAQKNADAVSLFGKSGLTMIPFLNKGREGIEEMNAAVEKYGATITGETLAANEKYQKSVVDLSLAWDSFKITIVGGIIPALTALLPKLAEVGKGVGDLIAQTLKKPGHSLGSFLSGFAGGQGIGGDGIRIAAGLAQVMGDSIADTAAAGAGVAPGTPSPADQAAQDKLAKSQKEAFELLKAGGEAAYALEQQRLAIAEAMQANDYADASALQAKIPGLEKAAALEKEQLAMAQHNLEIRQRIAILANQGPAREAARTSFRRAPTPFDLAGAPDLGAGVGNVDLGSVLGKIKPPEGLDIAQSALEDFYKSWGADAKKTADDVNATYADELKTLQGYLALGEINTQEFYDARVAMAKANAEALKAVYANSDAFGDQLKNFIGNVGDGASHVTKSFFADLQSGLDSVNSQLAKFIATGKQIDFKKLGQGVVENFASTGIKAAEGFGAKELGGLFGIGGKKDGSTSGSALFVTPVDAGGNILGALDGSGAGGALGSLPLGANPSAALAGLGSSSAAGAASSALGPLGGLFGQLLKFGGFLAGGGDVTPGKTYIVGENHPEFFTPSSHGQVAPSLKMSGGTPPPVINFHVHGVSDMDSFKRSQQQIGAGLAQQLSIASSRNR
jgi:hypothetical protein